MDEHNWLAERFEGDRPHLRAVAYRMLGSLSEADDAVQEAWLRLSRSDTTGVENLGQMADGGRRARVPGHAALAQVAARRAARPRFPTLPEEVARAIRDFVRRSHLSVGRFHSTPRPTASRQAGHESGPTRASSAPARRPAER
jgi:hypothetical protein